MAAIETGNPRPTNSRPAFRQRAIELLMLAAASLAFLFALAIAFGLVSG